VFSIALHACMHYLNITQQSAQQVYINLSLIFTHTHTHTYTHSGIYAGLGPTIVKQGSNQAIRFFVFYKLKQYMLGSSSADFSRNSWLGLAQSMGAGVSTYCIYILNLYEYS